MTVAGTQFLMNGSFPDGSDSKESASSAGDLGFHSGAALDLLSVFVQSHLASLSFKFLI